jgi:entericidin B
MLRISLVVLSLFALCSVTACNTVAGMGKDMKQGGEAIEKASGK